MCPKIATVAGTLAFTLVGVNEHAAADHLRHVDVQQPLKVAQRSSGQDRRASASALVWRATHADWSSTCRVLKELCNGPS